MSLPTFVFAQKNDFETEKKLIQIICRDLRETRQRFDSVGSEIKRKDNQIRELQQRLEVNEGCKCRFHGYFFLSCPNHSTHILYILIFFYQMTIFIFEIRAKWKRIKGYISV